MLYKEIEYYINIHHCKLSLMVLASYPGCVGTRLQWYMSLGEGQSSSHSKRLVGSPSACVAEVPFQLSSPKLKLRAIISK